MLTWLTWRNELLKVGGCHVGLGAGLTVLLLAECTQTGFVLGSRCFAAKSCRNVGQSSRCLDADAGRDTAHPFCVCVYARYMRPKGKRLARYGIFHVSGRA